MLHGEFPECKAGLLGEYFDIPSAIIETLKHDSNGDSIKFFSDVINHWLRNDPEKSWSKLADAIHVCDYKLLADRIRKKYVMSTPAEHSQQLTGKLVIGEGSCTLTSNSFAIVCCNSCKAGCLLQYY